MGWALPLSICVLLLVLSRFLADWFGWRVATSVYPPTLRNKVAIVTGANIGLGLETTKALLQVTCSLQTTGFIVTIPAC